MAAPPTLVQDGGSAEDPFLSASTNGNGHHAPHRYASYDNQLSSLYNTNSPSHAKRALEAHLKDTERRIQDASRLGQTLLKQRKDLSERLKDVELEQDDNEVGPELQKKLAELEREFTQVGKESARAFLPKGRVVSQDLCVPGSPPVVAGDIRPSPSKVSAPSRRQRNQPANRVHDIEFATEISTSLLAQVRQLQAVLAEKDDALKATTAEKSQLETEAANLMHRLKVLDESEQKYKEENWNLETQLQEIQSTLKALTDKEQRLNHILKTTQSEKDAAQRELDELKHAHGKLSEDHEIIKRQQDAELHTLRRDVANHEVQKTALNKRIEEITMQNQELAKAVAYRWNHGLQTSEREHDPNEEFPFPERVSPDHSPGPSPNKTPARHGMLETETLKSSLTHAHRMIQNLRNNIHREKTEKFELKRMLQDARDEVETLRSAGVGAINKKRRSEPEVKYRKPSRPDRLGASRTSTHEIIMDDEWEDQSEISPSRLPALRQSNNSFNSSRTTHRATFADYESTDAFDTANEHGATDSFETADELAGTTTESEAFQTGMETIGADSSEELTETEDTVRVRDLRTSRPSIFATSHVGDRRSYLSTASTDEESDAVNTPIQHQHPKLRLKNIRGRALGRNSELFAQDTVPNSPNSVESGPSRSHVGPQSLSAELEGLSDEDDEDDDDGATTVGTPTRSNLRSVPTSLEGSPERIVSTDTVRGADRTKPQMIDSGMMTEPWEPKPQSVVATAASAVSSAVAGVAGYTLGKSTSHEQENKEVIDSSFPQENKKVIKSSSPQESKEVIESSSPQENKEVIKPSSPQENKEVIETSSSQENKEVTEPSSSQENKEVIKPSFQQENKEAIKSSSQQENNEVAKSSPQPDNEIRAPQQLEVVRHADGSDVHGKSTAAADAAASKKDAISRANMGTPRAPLQKLTELVTQHTQPVAPASEKIPKWRPLDISTATMANLQPTPMARIANKEAAPLAISGTTTVETKPVFPRSRDVSPFTILTSTVAETEPVAPLRRKAASLAITGTTTVETKPVSPRSREVSPFTILTSIAAETKPIAPPEEPRREITSFATTVETEPIVPILPPIPAVTPPAVSSFATVSIEPIEPTMPKRPRAVDSFAMSSIVSQHLEPIEPVEDKALSGTLSKSSSLYTDSGFSPEIDEKATPEAGGAMVGTPFFESHPLAPPAASEFTPQKSDTRQRSPEGRLFASKSGNSAAPTMVHADENVEAPPADRPQSRSRKPFAEMANNVASGQRSASEKPPLTRSTTAEQGTQTMVSSEEIDDMVRNKAPVTSYRPSSSGSTRSKGASLAPPLPNDRHLKIAAAGGKTPVPIIASSGASATGQSASSGSMGPPAVPAFPYKSVNANTGTLARTRTPSVGRASQRGRGHHTGPRAPRVSNASTRPGTLEPPSPGRTRRSSVSSFASELEDRFNIDRANIYPDDLPLTTDPRMIQAITQTMIGEYLWKYTRKTGRSSEISTTRHRRFFWIHPYTRTLYWSETDPSAAGAKQMKAKSVAIEDVRVIVDENPFPPGLHSKSIVVMTPGREVVFTAPTAARHETWFNALSYLLLRTGSQREEDVNDQVGELTREDVDEFNPQPPRSFSRTTQRTKVSMSSYNSRATHGSGVSPHRTLPQQWTGEVPTLSQRRGSYGRNGSYTPDPADSVSGRFASIFKSPGSLRESFSSGRRSKSALSMRRPDDAIYEASVVEEYDSAEELRQAVERNAKDSSGMENVRACCNGEYFREGVYASWSTDMNSVTGKHDVGSLSRAGGRQAAAMMSRGPQSHSHPQHHHHHHHPLTTTNTATSRPMSSASRSRRGE